MPSKWEKSLLFDLAERINIKGETITSVAASVPCKHETLMRHFREENIIVYSHWKKPMQEKLPQYEIIARYIGGESELSLSQAYSVDRGIIQRILRNNNIPRRTISEANSIRMGKLSIEERKELVRNANEVWRVTDNTSALLTKAARTESGIANIRTGPGEEELSERLKELGFEVIRQKAFGTYNVDICFSTVAVEVRFGTSSFNNATKSAKRVKTISESGYKFTVVIFRDVTAIKFALDEVISLLQCIERKPTIWGKGWVIRCGLQQASIRKPKLDDDTAVPPPPELVTSIREIDFA